MTFDQLRVKLGVRDTAYSLKNKLKRTCGISHTKVLDLAQWRIVLAFMAHHYEYTTANTMLTRIEKII